MQIALISKSIEFDAGHRVPMHVSKCSNPHGHRYKVVAYVGGPIQAERGESDDGMVVDFGDLKRVLTDHVHDVYDHAFIAWEGDAALIELLEREGWKHIVTPWVPTAENLAVDVYDTLCTHLAAPLRVQYVEVWETPTSMARYPMDVQR
jgi:6-pyruvoyltetrahydropterin/6-carboxytetrahydropterin synthase